MHIGTCNVYEVSKHFVKSTHAEQREAVISRMTWLRKNGSRAYRSNHMHTGAITYKHACRNNSCMLERCYKVEAACDNYMQWELERGDYGRGAVGCRALGGHQSHQLLVLRVAVPVLTHRQSPATSTPDEISDF